MDPKDCRNYWRDLRWTAHLMVDLSKLWPPPWTTSTFIKSLFFSIQYLLNFSLLQLCQGIAYTDFVRELEITLLKVRFRGNLQLMRYWSWIEKVKREFTNF